MGNSMLITIGSLVILGLFSVASNTMISRNTQVVLQSEHYITAIALAQSVIDEAKTKSFDEKTTTTAVAKPESLSLTNAMGSDGAGEAITIDYVDLFTYKKPVVNDDVARTVYQTTTTTTTTYTSAQSLSKFDDVDDYHNYTRIVKTPSSGTDTIRTTVTYASVTCPDSSKSAQTYCKKMRVTISGQYLPSPFTLEYAYIY